MKPKKAKNTSSNEEQLVVEYDVCWKEMINDFFKDFVAFFLPQLYQDVDWKQEHEFLEQELIEILEEQDQEYDKKITDKLVLVHLKDGSEKRVLIHIEIESGHESGFNKRMFEYMVYVYARRQQQVTALAIMVGRHLPKNYQFYEQEVYGTVCTYRYNTYVVRAQKEEVLQASNNVFALAVLANLYVIRTYGDDLQNKRLAFKLKMIELLRKRNISEPQIVKLLTFIRHLMVLKQDLELSFETKVFSKVSKQKTMAITYTKDEWQFFDRFCRAYLDGKTLDEWRESVIEVERQKLELERQKAIEVERQKLELERQKAIEVERQKLELERQKAIEVERQKLELERQKAIEAERQNEENSRRVIINLHLKMGLDVAGICDLQPHLDKNFVVQVLDKLKT